jgi:very-short-patch-repair endonuclease
LIIELDGGQHAENTRDAVRDSWLQTEGYRVARFWNNDVLANIEGVIEVVLTHLDHPLPNPLPSRERG